MGYTHYWTVNRAFTADEWREITTAANAIIKRSRAYFIYLSWEYDQPIKPPEVSDSLIRFNGVLEDGHETFYFTRQASEFEFCKTARKNYDAPVVAILIAAAYFAPDKFSWRSEGTPEDHANGLRLFCEATGKELRVSNVRVEL